MAARRKRGPVFFYSKTHLLWEAHFLISFFYSTRDIPIFAELRKYENEKMDSYFALFLSVGISQHFSLCFYPQETMGKPEHLDSLALDVARGFVASTVQ